MLAIPIMSERRKSGSESSLSPTVRPSGLERSEGQNLRMVSSFLRSIPNATNHPPAESNPQANNFALQEKV
jgi:hypothetical protein